MDSRTAGEKSLVRSGRCKILNAEGQRRLVRSSRWPSLLGSNRKNAFCRLMWLVRISHQEGWRKGHLLGIPDCHLSRTSAISETDQRPPIRRRGKSSILILAKIGHNNVIQVSDLPAAAVIADSRGPHPRDKKLSWRSALPAWIRPIWPSARNANSYLLEPELDEISRAARLPSLSGSSKPGSCLLPSCSSPSGIQPKPSLFY